MPAEMRSVPVLVETRNADGPLESRNERLLVTMLEGYDLADGLKRADVERELNLKRTRAGDVLQDLTKRRYITNESPFTKRTSSSAYWLTDLGRSVAESVLRRRAGAAVEQATRREEEF
jgi:hypothetical protein